MKVAIMSDIHFNAFKPFATYEAGENSRLLEICKAFDWAIDDAVWKGCELLLIPGDLFHTRGNLRPSILNRVFGCVAKAASKLAIVMIPGNHDMENYKGGATAIDSLSYINNVYVLGNSTSMVVRGVNIAGIPYIHDHKEFLVEFKKLVDESIASDDKFDCVMIHQGIDNFASPGMPSMDITSATLRAIYSGPIFAGHYHVPRKDGMIVSPGSLIQHGFGDSDEPKGYWIWDTDGDSIDLQEVVGPKFMTVTTAKEASGTGGRYVRVVADSVKGADKLRAAAEKAGAIGIVAKIDKKFVTAHEEALALAAPREMLHAWLQMMPETKENAAELMSLLDEICIEVKEEVAA